MDAKGHLQKLKKRSEIDLLLTSLRFGVCPKQSLAHFGVRLYYFRLFRLLLFCLYDESQIQVF